MNGAQFREGCIGFDPALFNRYQVERKLIFFQPNETLNNGITTSLGYEQEIHGRLVVGIRCRTNATLQGKPTGLSNAPLNVLDVNKLLLNLYDLKEDLIFQDLPYAPLAAVFNDDTFFPCCFRWNAYRSTVTAVNTLIAATASLPIELLLIDG